MVPGLLNLAYATDGAIIKGKPVIRMSLLEFVIVAREKNLDFKIEKSKLESAEALSVGVNVPPPMVGFITMQPETGASVSGFEINQSIPFPTKLSADSSARKFLRDAQVETQKSRNLEIFAEGKLIYISLWAAQEKVKLLEDKKKILIEHIKLARSTARSDSFSKIHLLKSESDLDFLTNDIESANQLYREIQIQAAQFLNLNPEEVNWIVTEPPLSDIPQLNSVDQVPQIRTLQFELEKSKSQRFEAKSSWLPDFNLKYKKMNSSTMSEGYSEIMVGVTLPFLFFWEPNANSKKASADVTSAEYEFEKSKRKYQADSITLKARCESFKKQILTIETQSIPRAEMRMKLVHNIAPRDMESLQDHRETMEALPELELKLLDLRLQFEKAISELQKYAIKTSL
jgi:outer membrane protein TolC